MLETKEENGEEVPDEVEYEVEDLQGQVFDAPPLAVPVPEVAYKDAPLVTLRSLMPGDTGEADPNDYTLDMTFRANQVEFILVVRQATTDEIQTETQIEPIHLGDWQLPADKMYNNAMTVATAAFAEEDPTIIHALNWSSINSRTGAGVFSMKTCLLYTSPSPRDGLLSRMPSSA